jgi:hypothetical protein
MSPGQRRPCTLGDVEVILSSGPPTPTGPQRRRSLSDHSTTGEVLEQEIYNDLDTVLNHQWPHTPAQKPTPNKAKRNSSIFFRTGRCRVSGARGNYSQLPHSSKSNLKRKRIPVRMSSSFFVLSMYFYVQS